MEFSWLRSVTNESPLFFIIGPCAIESETYTLKAAEYLTELSQKLSYNFIFKAAFDKANRTSLKGYRGLGLDEGCNILSKVKKQFNIPIITDVHESIQISSVSQVADVIQIPAFLCRQTDLLISAGKTGKPVNIKKGQFVSPDSMIHAHDKVASTGNHHSWLCERGTSFGYNNLIVDFRSLSIMRQMNRPVIFDATHSVQRPSGLGTSSGGDRSFVSSLATAAVTQRIAGIFMEVHETPEKALCDGPNSIRHSDLEALLIYLIELDQWIKSRNQPSTN